MSSKLSTQASPDENRLGEMSNRKLITGQRSLCFPLHFRSIIMQNTSGSRCVRPDSQQKGADKQAAQTKGREEGNFSFFASTVALNPAMWYHPLSRLTAREEPTGGERQGSQHGRQEQADERTECEGIVAMNKSSGDVPADRRPAKAPPPPPRATRRRDLVA